MNISVRDGRLMLWVKDKGREYGSSIVDNEWHHVSYVYKEQRLRGGERRGVHVLYLDGEEDVEVRGEVVEGGIGTD